MGKKKHKSVIKKIFGVFGDIIEEILEFIVGAIVLCVLIFVLLRFTDASLDGFVNRIQSFTAQFTSRLDETPTTTVGGVEVEEVIVTEVIDGDTIEVSTGETVRLIGVNTPESTNEVEPYGKEAAKYTEEMLLGETVWLTKDSSDVDQYGRQLRFVWLEEPTAFTEDEFREKCFNAQLVLNGYATAYTFEADDTYSEYFKKFDREAQAEGVGMWAIDPNGTTKGDFS